MKIWLDDVRDPVKYGFLGWIWVKTAEDAIIWLKDANVEKISLDHDLAWEHQPASGVLESQYESKTGYNVVCWMEEHKVFPLEVQIHSANSVGRENMCRVLDKFYSSKVVLPLDLIYVKYSN